MSGFHYFFQGTIPWILAIAIAAVIIIRAFFPDVKLPDMLGPLNWAQVFLIAAGVAAFLILTRIISVDGPSDFVERGIGIYICLPRRHRDGGRCVPQVPGEGRRRRGSRSWLHASDAVLIPALSNEDPPAGRVLVAYGLGRGCA